MVSFVCARLRAPLRPLSTEGAGSRPRAFPRPRPSSWIRVSRDAPSSTTDARASSSSSSSSSSFASSLARRSSPIARETRIHRDRRRETLASGTTSATDRTRARRSRARRERVIERNKNVSRESSSEHAPPWLSTRRRASSKGGVDRALARGGSVGRVCRLCVFIIGLMGYVF